jgi:hypothetical protein
MASPDGPPPPVSNTITGTWRNSFADKDQKGRALQRFDRVEELVCDRFINDLPKYMNDGSILFADE